jgi:hypothetical protein
MEFSRSLFRAVSNFFFQPDTVDQNLIQEVWQTTRLKEKFMQLLNDLQI